MQTYHIYKHDGKKYQFVHDDDYQTEGRYSLDTPEETLKAEDYERAKLDSGEWVVLGCIVYGPHGCNCSHCPGTEIDSLWGIVIENSTEAVERFVREGGI